MSLLELIYYLGYSLKKHGALKRQKRLPRRVISIGNLTLGGTGKTPAAIALARECQKRGWKPCILTRGYRGKVVGPCFVSMGEEPLLDEKQAGDEALLMAQKLRGVPIVKGQDRHHAGMFALDGLSSAGLPDLFILDDGFQHWSLFRDKDVLLIDSTNPFGNGKLFPVGPLREPLREIGRADIVVITKARSSVKSQKSEDTIPAKEIKRYNQKATWFYADHRPSGFVTMKGEKLPLEWVKGKKFFGVCGIGNPASFEKTLISLGVMLNGLKKYRDHYRYRPADIRDTIKEAVARKADWIVTTEKDMVRLRGLEVPENLVALVIDFSVDKGFYDIVLGV
ncbi:MAG: tetraacyldisaccharide 4'-kinase [Nitrospirota bacterium]